MVWWESGNRGVEILVTHAVESRIIFRFGHFDESHPIGLQFMLMDKVVAPGKTGRDDKVRRSLVKSGGLTQMSKAPLILGDWLNCNLS